MTSSSRRIETRLYLLARDFGFWAPFSLQGLTWAMLYLWTQNYPQIVGTCSGHHVHLISQNFVPTKIRVDPPPPLNKFSNNFSGGLLILIYMLGKTSLNGFEGHISQNVAKMAILWPKKASATLMHTLHMVITWSFLIKF